LGGDALANFCRGPTSFGKPAALGMRRAGDTNDRVEFRLRVRFEKERNNDDRTSMSFGTRNFNLALPFGSNARVKDFFEFLTRIWIGKHQICENVAKEAAIGGDYIRAEKTLDFGEGRLAGFDEIAGENVGIYNWNFTLAKERGGGRFPHADATG
jgi:hypothetical protein